LEFNSFLIYPFLDIPVPARESETLWRADPEVPDSLDWHELRNRDIASDVGVEVEHF
jgi:hypothetical protein